MDFPAFWTQIELNLGLDPNGINTIKQLLTLLEYTTIQSVSKLTNKTAIEPLEMEFFKLKKSDPDLMHKYPCLQSLKFGSGFITILTDIATKVKKRFTGWNHDSIQNAVFDEIRLVRQQYNNYVIVVNIIFTYHHF